VFPPGDYLRDELEARSWSVTDFAQIIARPVQAVSEILNNRKEITAETATEIGAALGTTAEVWLDLQNAYRLHKIRNQTRLSDVQRRAKLRARIPLAEVQKRGWIPSAKDLDVVEAAVCDFLHIADLDEQPRWEIAARRSNDAEETLTPSQRAWVAQAARLAADVKVRRFDPAGLAGLARDLPQRLVDPQRLADVRDWLPSVGVAFVVVEHLQGSKIDGAAFRLENGTPVVALSLRGNRFDSVVFTLVHEIAHIVLGHADGKCLVIDEDAASEHPTNDVEEAANHLASSWLFRVPIEIAPPISQAKVLKAARALGVHPALLVGRLQWAGKLPWSSLRGLVPKAKEVLPFS
jgi:HTH-type transcriptional regulator/antitoxin HigA